jgi:uncharacterized protein YeaO (DUF488 family)
MEESTFAAIAQDRLVVHTEASVAVRVTRLGSPRARGEGIRLGTVRRPPRGVPKADYAKRYYFDLWLPELAPSAELVKRALSAPLTDARWAAFARSYRREMQQSARRHLVELLARMSHRTNFSVGCYCERADRCHRSILGELLAASGARLIRERSAPAQEGDAPGARLHRKSTNSNRRRIT